MQLTLQLWSEGDPVALQDRIQIVVGVPIFGRFVVDRAGLLVEDRLRIAVFTDGRIDSLPDVELFAGAPVIAKGRFVGDVVAHGNQGVAEITAVRL